LKTVATKEVGPSKFDTAKQQEKQHGTEFDQPAQAGRLHLGSGPGQG
jgi:hypothetical protein